MEREHGFVPEPSGLSRRAFLKAAGIAACASSLLGAEALAAEIKRKPKAADARHEPRKKIKITFIGGGSQTWAPNIIRDITFKEGLENLEIEFAVLDIHLGRAQAIHNLFQAKFKEWGVKRVTTYPTLDKAEAIRGADIIIIAISTGRLPAMKWDLEVPERYGIYQTVGDTCGPGGWGRALRNIPVFQAYARQIKELAPNAFVLNYTNPLAVLTKVLSKELGAERVVGLCHGLFECYGMFRELFGLESEREIQVRFGGVNHFFWILDLKINGADGGKMLREKLGGRKLAEIYDDSRADALKFVSHRWLASELYENYGWLPYIGDRHTCEFFGCYINNKAMMDRFKLIRTSIADREKMYVAAAQNIEKWTQGGEGLSKKPSRETAADMIKAIVHGDVYTDVVNLVNNGQIPNLTMGAVVETLGQVSARGFSPLTVGPLPEPIRAVEAPHTEIQLRVVDAGLAGDLEGALMALAAEPSCSHMTVSDIKKLGRDVLEPNKQYLPQFFKVDTPPPVL